MARPGYARRRCVLAVRMAPVDRRHAEAFAMRTHRRWLSLSPSDPPALCYDACVGKKKKTRRDSAEIVRSVVEQAIGEELGGEA